MENNDNFALGFAMGQDNNCGRGNGNGIFGGDGWLGIILLVALLGGGFGFGGLGGGGMLWPMLMMMNGGFGGFGGGGSALQGMATRADINEGFALNNITSGIAAIQQGICDATYALNNTVNQGFNATQTTMMQGFNTVQTGMMQGFNSVERGFCDLSHQLSDCCCENRQAIAQVRYDMANQTRDIIEGQNNSTRAILDFLTNDKISTLTAENQSLKFQASQANQNAFITANQQAQTAELIRRLGRDCPVPAYVVPNPNCCYGNPVGVSYGGNCNCQYS